MMKLSCEFYGYFVCPIFLTLLASVVAARDITDLPYPWCSSCEQIDTPKTHSKGSNAALLLVKLLIVANYYLCMYSIQSFKFLRLIYQSRGCLIFFYGRTYFNDLACCLSRV